MAKALHYDPTRNKTSKELLFLANKLADMETRSAADAIRLVAMEAGTIKLNHPEKYRDFINSFSKKIKQNSTFQSA